MNVSNYDIIIIIIYFVFLFTIGFFRRSKNHISQTDYIVYGRKLSLPGFVITLVSTWYGAILGVGVCLIAAPAMKTELKARREAEARRKAVLRAKARTASAFTAFE